MARSLNRVQLIGNLTRDPELRYTPQGTAVCTIGLATNRSWTTDGGDKKEEVEYHKIIAWNKLGELCSQLLSKGRKIYVEGRLSTRSWTGQDGAQRTTTEIVIDDMIILDSRKDTVESHEEAPYEEPVEKAETKRIVRPASTQRGEPDQDKTKKEDVKKQDENTDEVNPDDIPF